VRWREREAWHVSLPICMNITHLAYPLSSLFDSSDSSSSVGSGGSTSPAGTTWHAVLLKAEANALGGGASACTRKWLPAAPVIRAARASGSEARLTQGVYARILPCELVRGPSAMRERQPMKGERRSHTSSRTRAGRSRAEGRGGGCRTPSSREGTAHTERARSAA
jgi:hypothetical protein